MRVASLLKGKKTAHGISLGITCGSRQVLEMAGRNGALADIVASGARILESARGFCIGNSMAPRTDAVSVRTSNRNFYARSGTSSANVYLVSPETAVAAALAGKLVDPTIYFSHEPYRPIVLPDSFTIDDSMILEPSDAPDSVHLYRGPNIGLPPDNDRYPDMIHGVVTIYLDDKITTDHIMPAGNRLKYRSNIPKYADYVFERIDPEFASKSLANKAQGKHTIIVAGESYGQGSSREHAALCPMYLGVKVIIAKSIERIHKANLINFGIIPAIFDNLDDYNAVGPGDELQADNIHALLREGNRLIFHNASRGISFTVRIDLTGRQRNILLAGGLINATVVVKDKHNGLQISRTLVLSPVNCLVAYV